MPKKKQSKNKQNLQRAHAAAQKRKSAPYHPKPAPSALGVGAGAAAASESNSSRMDGKYQREWFPGGPSASDIFPIVLFLLVWAGTGFLAWFISRYFGVAPTPCIVIGAIVGFVSACIIFSFKKLDGFGGGNMFSGFETWY